MVKCMDLKKYLKSYFTKLNAEAALKASLLGFAVGFGAALLYAVASLLFFLKYHWIAYIVFGVFFAATFAIAFFRLKPSQKQVAARVDLVGLEERVLTMNELKDRSDLVANMQREDTMQALQSVNAKKVVFAISLPLIIVASVISFLGLSTSVVTSLAANELIDVGQHIGDGDDPGGIIPPRDDEGQIQYFTVEYLFEGEGMIQGQVFQVVEKGGSTEPVLAVGDDEWGFMVWIEDGLEEPYRMEYDVQEDLVFTAIFMQGEGGSPSPNGQPTEGNEGQEADDDGQQPGDQGQEGQDSPDPHSQDQPGGGAGGQYENVNQVIDGETYYGGNVFENANAEMMEELSNSGDYSSEEQDLITDYFNTIKK